ncbi:unnamed protein product [Oikopleura dioica]|uniref:ribonuclease H n=1 Tax=Oikopleura dioica TaxID=34765 RepID=E4WY99_OIKDI|nr:unnamed protein product [Oikopleura dioica]
MNTQRLSEKFRTDVNKSLRRVKDKAFKSSEPRQGRYRAVDVKDVEVEFYAYAMALEELEQRPFFGEPEPTEEYKGFKESEDEDEDEEESEDSESDSDSGRPEIISENNRIFRLMLDRSDKHQQVGAIFKEQNKITVKFDYLSTDKFGNKVRKSYFLVYDTGANTTLIPESLLMQLQDTKQVTTKKINAKPGAGAGGITIQLLDIKASFKLTMGKLELIVKDAAVHNGRDQQTILFGMTDWILNKVEFRQVTENNQEITVRGEPLSRLWNYFTTEIKEEWNVLSQQFRQIETESLKVETSVKSEVDPRNELSSIVFDMAPTGKMNPDSMHTFWRRIEKIYKESLKINTINDVKIDEFNEVLDLSKPADVMFKRKIRKILFKYKSIFGKTQGVVPGSEYVVQGQIKGNPTGKFSMQPFERSSPEVKKQIVDKLNSELAQGVLKILPPDMQAENFMNIFPVKKKDLPGMSVEERMANIRLVSDCSRGINENTKFAKHEMDNIRDCIQKMAPFTESGLIGQCDISAMFFSFKLDRSLWPHFCNRHPEIGTLCYTRLPMGWCQSPSISRDFLARIYYSCNDYLCRYCDDLVFSGKTRDEYLDNLENILRITHAKNLRFSGKKMALLSKTMKILGKEISGGKIKIDQHTVNKIITETPETVKTVRQLRTVLGRLAFISDSIPSRVEVTHKLAEVAGGKNSKEPIIWTEELRVAFNNMKNTVEKSLVELYPIVEGLETILVCDSSYLATGAFLCQIKDGKRRLIRMYSRKRSDLANRISMSSCLLEISGLVGAVSHFKVDLQLAKTVTRVYTDSRSVEKLYHRLLRGESLCDDLRINTHLLQLMNHELEIIYLEDKSEYITLADHISRNSSLSQNCTSNGCKVCLAADAPILRTFDLPMREDLRDSKGDQFMFLEHLVPVRKISTYEETQEIKDDYLWWHEQRANFETERFLPFNAELLNFAVSRTNPSVLKDYPELSKYKLNDLIADKELLHKIQIRDKRLRAVILAKEDQILPGAKNRPGETARWKMECENGVVVTHRNFGVRKVKIPVVPERLTNWVAQRIHSENGCTSLTSMLNEAKATIETPKIKDALKAIIGRCRKCTFFRNLPNTILDLKEYKDLSPTKVGEVVSWDQLTRKSELNKNKQLRYWIIIDHLTAYCKLYPVEGTSTAENNKIALLRAIREIADESVANVKVITDGAKCNESLVKDKELENNNITVIITNAATRSKNNLAILDTRLAKMTKYITMALNDTQDPWLIAQKVEMAHNRLKGTHGYSPNELRSGTCQNTGKSLDINWEKLRTYIRKARKMSRKANDKMARKKLVRDPMQFVPFDQDDVKASMYGGKLCSPLKLGDIIILSGAFDKNNARPFWQIVQSEEIPTGIDFDNRIVSTVKMDLRKVQKSSRKIWSFDAIKAVSDGRQDLSEDQIARSMNFTPDEFEPLITRLNE